MGRNSGGTNLEVSCDSRGEGTDSPGPGPRYREGEETFDHFMDLKFYLEDLLGRRTDLVIADTLKPRIRNAVLGEVVYA